MTCIVVQVVADDGGEGVGAVWNATSFDFDRYTAEAMRHLLPVLVGKDPLARDAILHEMRPRVFPLPPGAIAAIEVALFDLAAKEAGVPLHRLLGGTRDRLPAYASPPMLASVPRLPRLRRGVSGCRVSRDQVPHLVRSGARPRARAGGAPRSPRRRRRLHARRREQLHARASDAGGARARRSRLPLVRGAAAGPRPRGLPRPHPARSPFPSCRRATGSRTSRSLARRFGPGPGAPRAPTSP